MKVALIHDWLVTMGGAERVLEELARLFPEAPIYTGVVNRANLSPFLKTREIIPTFVQRFPLVFRWYNRYLPFLLYGFEQFDLSSYDLVISSSAALAKGVVTRAETRHIAYVHTPMRYAWDLYHEYRNREARGLSKRLMGPMFHYVRLWDRISADRVDEFIANSRTVQQRIWKHYRRPAEVIHPPVDVERFQVSQEPGQYYLALSRLVAYKRIDLAIEAANRAKLPLVVAGDGPERKRLEAMAGPTVQFVGRVGEDRMAELMQKAMAFLFPGEEDFGIAPVESQAAGRPVIGYGRGGILDTVIPGETGILFSRQQVEDLIAAMEQARTISWDPYHIRRHAERFRPEIFRERLSQVIHREESR